MLLGSIFILLVAAGAEAALGAKVNAQGVLSILGNSFGRPGFNATYDYVIVGGGNAGNTIAARLAQDPANYSIAVVEAGSFYEIVDGNRTQVPGYNWINTLDFSIGQVSTQTSIALNTLPQACISPTVGSFRKWAAQVGDNFWAWDEVYPAYKPSYTFQPPDYTKVDPSQKIDFDPLAFNAIGGPLHVSYGNYFGPSGTPLQAAMRDAGLESIPGLNSGKLIGYGTMTAAVDIGTATRDSSETSFLQTGAQDSSNLKIYPNTLVKRVTFDGQKRATGVEVQVNLANVKLDLYLSANKEVIVSTGVWHSPQILMVSGVGPSETLSRYDLEVISDLPGVGQNEWDQPLVPFLFTVNVSTNTQCQAGNQAVVATAISDYLNHQSGLLSGVGTGLAVGFEKYLSAYRSQFSNSTQAWLNNFPSDWPEVEYVSLKNIPISQLKALLGTIEPTENFLSFNGVLLSTQSRGNVTITSTDTLDQPKISPNWLANGSVDLEQAVAAFRRMRGIFSKCSIVTAEAFPGPTVNTTEEIVSFMRENMNHLYLQYLRYTIPYADLL
ncbi:hypothetical protein BDR22DRAFT_963041 [Usnea florida]